MPLQICIPRSQKFVFPQENKKIIKKSTSNLVNISICACCIPNLPFPCFTQDFKFNQISNTCTYKAVGLVPNQYVWVLNP